MDGGGLLLENKFGVSVFLADLLTGRDSIMMRMYSICKMKTGHVLIYTST